MIDFSRVRLSRLMLVIGLFQIAVYWFAGSISCVDGAIGIPQPDTPLYYQAARRIVEGHPFSYSEGSAACTGTTTVLYPFVLAIPYALGFTGDSMLVAGFVLNALFYLIFLWGWCSAIGNWIDRAGTRLLACLLIALSCHCAYDCFSQSDIGFYLAFSGIFAAALSSRNNLYVAVLLSLLPWVRPEGMICVVAYTMISAVYAFLVKCERRAIAGRVLISALGLTSVFGVFALNYFLTGHCQFSSVAGKGYFANLPFAQAFFASVADLFIIVKEMFLGLAKTMPRELISFPVFGIALLLIGIIKTDWRGKDGFGIAVFSLAVLGSIANVAQSGWQGSNMDRYLAWTIPLGLFFTASGVMFFYDLLPAGRRLFAPVLVFVLAAVGAVCGPFMLSVATKSEDCTRHFAHACEAAMTKGASLGGNGGCAVAYFCSPRRFAHLSGIYSPEFSSKNYVDNIERLRNDPTTRFDYWLITPDVQDLFGKEGTAQLGEVEVSGPSALTLVKADWSIFDATAPSMVEDQKLVAKIDLGYEQDELAADYQVFMRWGFEEFDPYVQIGKLNGKNILDVGRVILGGDEMSVPLTPGKNAKVVMRLWPSHGFFRKTGTNNSRMECAFANPLKMNLSIDGNVVDTVSVGYATNCFTDVSFAIPGSAIKQSPCRVGFLGDHIAFGYWFYQ